MAQIRTRFAPSPTGYVHLGNIRTALFAWAYARHYDGKFILRIEDTDVERSTPAAVQVVLDVMQWLGLDYDEGPFFQMKRMDLYRAKLEQLKQAGLVYPCYMSMEELDALRKEQEANNQKPRYDGRWRPEEGKTLPTPPAGVQPVLRFKNPARGFTEFRDVIKGRITVANMEMDDFVVARPDGTPTYNFCVVVDDIDMAITHVIRGDDHVNNTPRQINLYRALGAELPIFAHTPTVLTPQGKKLSKREGAKSVLEYKREGYLPSAMINMLGRLGWSHGDMEVFTPKDFVRLFDIAQVSSAASRFDPNKLVYLNRQHIRASTPQDLINLMWPKSRPFIEGLSQEESDEILLKAVELQQPRSDTLVELQQNVDYFICSPDTPAEFVEEHLTKEVKSAIIDLSEQLKISPWEAPVLKTVCRDAAQAHNVPPGGLMQPLRILLTGQTKTPPLDEVMCLLGRQQTLERISV